MTAWWYWPSLELSAGCSPKTAVTQFWHCSFESSAHAAARERERTKQYEQDKNNYKYQGCILSECWSFTLSIAYVNNTNNYQMHKNKRLFSRPLEPTQIEQKLLSHANNRSLAPEKFVYFSAFIIAVNFTRTPKAISTIRSITMLYAKAANKQSMTTKSQPIGWMR